MRRVEHLADGVTLYCGDCLEVLPTLGKADVTLTDPPYGVKRDKGFDGFGGFGAKIARRRYEGDNWDSERPPPEIFDEILLRSSLAIIFGGNFFSDILPRSTHWIVWDKLNTMPTFGDCELAWTNSPRKSVRKFTVEYNGLIGREDERFHPTQKPLKLFSKIVAEYSSVDNIIMDPFMGSGTTGVAAVKGGRKFVGVEREPKYFDIACKRISEALKQPDLFIEPPKPAKQESLILL